MSHSQEEKNIKVLQWNTRGIQNKMYELAHRANNYDILLISETMLNLTKTVRMKGFDVVRSDRLYAEGGGVAVFVRSNFSYSILEVEDMDLDIEVCGSRSPQH